MAKPRYLQMRMMENNENEKMRTRKSEWENQNKKIRTRKSEREKIKMGKWENGRHGGGKLEHKERKYW